MLNWLQPSLVLDSVTSLTPEVLERHNIRFLLLDVDSTLKRYRADEIPPETVQWIQSLRESGIQFCILSNGRAHRIRPIAEQVQIPFIAPAMKPSPFGCRAAIKSLNFDPHTTGIVGDQVFADILAGKFAKIFTILVTPIHPEEEHWYTRIKRPLEKWVLRSQSEWLTEPRSSDRGEHRSGYIRDLKIAALSTALSTALLTALLRFWRRGIDSGGELH